MGFLDKIIDTMHLGSEDDYDDYDDFEDDDYEDGRSKRNIFKKRTRITTMIWKMM